MDDFSSVGQRVGGGSDALQPLKAGVNEMHAPPPRPFLTQGLERHPPFHKITKKYFSVPSKPPPKQKPVGSTHAAARDGNQPPLRADEEDESRGAGGGGRGGGEAPAQRRNPFSRRTGQAPSSSADRGTAVPSGSVRSHSRRRNRWSSTSAGVECSGAPPHGSPLWYPPGWGGAAFLEEVACPTLFASTRALQRSGVAAKDPTHENARRNLLNPINAKNAQRAPEALVFSQNRAVRRLPREGVWQPGFVGEAGIEKLWLTIPATHPPASGSGRSSATAGLPHRPVSVPEPPAERSSRTTASSSKPSKHTTCSPQLGKGQNIFHAGRMPDPINGTPPQADEAL